MVKGDWNAVMVDSTAPLYSLNLCLGWGLRSWSAVARNIDEDYVFSLFGNMLHFVRNCYFARLDEFGGEGGDKCSWSRLPVSPTSVPLRFRRRFWSNVALGNG